MIKFRGFFFGLQYLFMDYRITKSNLSPKILTLPLIFGSAQHLLRTISIFVLLMFKPLIVPTNKSIAIPSEVTFIYYEFIQGVSNLKFAQQSVSRTWENPGSYFFKP